MKRDNINYFYVGCFTLAMLFLLVFSLLKMTGRGSDTDFYYTMYNNVSGIRQGTTVTYGGFKVGQLVDITPLRENGKTHYKLKLSVKSGWPIPTDSFVRVVSPGLLAEAQIDISEGTAADVLEPEGLLVSRPSLDMMAVLSSMGGEFSNLNKNGLIPLLKNINKQVDGFGNNLPEIVGDSRELVSSLNTVSKRLANLLTPENSSRLSNTISNTDKITGNLVNLSSRLNNIMEQLQGLVTNSNQLLADNSNDVRQSVLDLRKALNSVSQNMETIMYNMDVSSRNISEFSHQIRSNPGVLLNSKPVKDEVK
ncbi:hypothetical protein MNBD_GAMMA23-1840 [hydrothermal vent metagenome]|uniref:Mce/MlaD domain-containing protein n=1 Tax=hydrothermal vent metagenome TaxID=652676 RepID=A0A3B0ZYW5_9ZZZZ